MCKRNSLKTEPWGTQRIDSQGDVVLPSKDREKKQSTEEGTSQENVLSGGPSEGSDLE